MLFRRSFGTLTYERHGAVAIDFTDGAGNEERQPDALYEWRP